MSKFLLLQVIFSLVTGAIAVFSYAPFSSWSLAFISFSSLLLLVNQKTVKRAALLGFIWGVGYFSAGVHWVYVSIKQYGDLPTPLAILILALLVSYLSLYPMLFALILRLLNHSKYYPAYSFKQLALLAPLIWQLTEIFRATILGGFSWLQFGYSQLASPLGGLFPLFGINGVNIIFSFCCGLLCYILLLISKGCRDRHPINKSSLYRAACTITVIFITSYWFKTVHWVHLDPTRHANISLLQGNISQSLRWNSEQLDNTLKTYSKLTKESLDQSDIIIWPEAAITDLELNQQDYLTQLDQLAIEKNAAIAVGIIDLTRTKKDYAIYNSLIVLGDKKPYQYPTQNRYTKHYLVPFGEYTPLESLLKPFAQLLNIPMSSMSAGPAIQEPLVMKDFRFVTAICYEIVLSDIIWQNFTADTDFLLTVSNDAWFGNTIGPWQHLQIAQARALEFGRTLLRSTNNGITTVISPQGEITQQLPQFETATLSILVKPSVGLTPYAQWRNYPYYVMLFILAISILLRRKN